MKRQLMIKEPFIIAFELFHIKNGYVFHISAHKMKQNKNSVKLVHLKNKLE